MYCNLPNDTFLLVQDSGYRSFYRLAMCLCSLNIQWNLSIPDILYSGHLSIADTFSRNQLSPAMVKPLYFEPLYSGHLSIADTISENQWCLLLRGFTVIDIQAPF